MTTTPVDYDGLSVPKRITDNIPEAFTTPIFGARYPAVFPSARTIREHYRSAADAKIEETEVAVLKDPYTQSDKFRLEDAYTKDPIVHRCITVYVNFLLGRRMTTNIDTNKEFMNQDLQKQVLSDTLNEAEVDDLKTLIDRTNTQVKFHARVEAAATQAFVGGRSALKVETAQGGMPTSLKVLNWAKLGRVFADKETWQFLGVEYADKPKDEPLLAKEILYFVNEDFNISPDSLYHGRSKFESVLDAVETNRYIHEEDIKEAARSLWASRGLIKFPPGTSAEKVREFSRKLLPGTWNTTSQQVDAQELGLDVKIKDLTETGLSLDRRIRTGIGTPGLLVGDENVLNYATASMVMHAWRESDLNRHRTWLQDTLEPQWFNTLIQLKFPDIDIEKMWLKAKLEFEDITFETLRDRAESLIPAVQSGYLSVEKFLEVLDMPDEIEKRAALLEQKNQQRAQELEMMRMERDKKEENNKPPQFQKKDEEEDDDDEEDKKAAALMIAKEAAESVRDDVLREVKRIVESEREQQPQQPQTQLESVNQAPITYHHQEEEVKPIPPPVPNTESLQAIQTLQASLYQNQEQRAEAEHQKKMALLEEKAEAYRTLKSKIADLSSSD
jgi:hypothetical protein